MYEIHIAMTCQQDFGFPGDYQFSVAQVGLMSESYLDKSKPFSPRLLVCHCIRTSVLKVEFISADVSVSSVMSGYSTCT